MANWEKAQFSIDSIPSKTFEGYSNGDDWNGWACPFFEFETAQQILKLSEANGYSWSYEADNDTFAVRNSEDPADYSPEEFAGTKIQVDGHEFTVYGIGAYSWIWEVAETIK